MSFLSGEAEASQLRDQFLKMEGESLQYTLDEALTAMRFGKFQVLVLVYAGLGWFSEAMEIMILSFVGPAVKSKWKLSSGEESLLTTVVFAGMLIGAYSWGLLSDNCGRRFAIYPLFPYLFIYFCFASFTCKVRHLNLVSMLARIC